MYVNARDKVGDWRGLRVQTPTGELISDVYAANTDAGWFERYVRDSDTKRLTVLQGDILTRRTHTSFDLVDKKTGKIVAQSR